VAPRPLVVPVELPAPMPADAEQWVGGRPGAPRPSAAPAWAWTWPRWKPTRPAPPRSPRSTPWPRWAATHTRGGLDALNRSFGTSTSASVGVQLNWPLYTGGARRTASRRRWLLEEQSRNSLEAARRGVAQATRQAYFGAAVGPGAGEGAGSRRVVEQAGAGGHAAGLPRGRARQPRRAQRAEPAVLKYRIKTLGRGLPIEKWPWGTAGPKLVTHYLKTTGEISHAQPIDTFYSIPSNKIELLAQEKSIEINELNKNIYWIHLWGKELRQHINQEYNGKIPKESFLYNMIKSHSEWAKWEIT
jgi:hypothetical protein